MRNLIFVSLIACLSSCVPAGVGKTKRSLQQLPALETEFPQTFIHKTGSEFIYKAALDFSYTHFSGIMVFKMLENGNLRASLITEVGSKIFDLEMSDSGREIHYCIGPLSKSKAVMDLIEEDFRILFLKGIRNEKSRLYGDSNTFLFQTHLKKKKVFYSAHSADRKVYSIQRGGGLKGKMKVTLSEYDPGFPAEIHISHPRIRLSISLSPREKNKA